MNSIWLDHVYGIQNGLKICQNVYVHVLTNGLKRRSDNGETLKIELTINCNCLNEKLSNCN